MWARLDAVRTAEVDAPLWLTGADPDTAWFVDRSDLDPAPPMDRPPKMPSGRLVAIHPDGTSTEIVTERPVFAVTARDRRVWVLFCEPHIVHTPDAVRWRFGPPISAFTATREELLARGMEATEASETPEADPTGHRPHAWIWLNKDRDLIIRYGLPALGRLWWAGADPGGDRIDRHANLAAHDLDTGEEVLRVDLGVGRVSDLQQVGDEMWVSVTQGAWRPFEPDCGASVFAVTSSRGVRTVLAADAVDITHFAPRHPRPPQQQIDHSIEALREMFQGFEGPPVVEPNPLLRWPGKPTDFAIAVEGDWPETRVVMTFRHPVRDGVVMRRTMRVFTDDGFPVAHKHAGAYLDEDIATKALPPVERAVDGILDI